MPVERGRSGEQVIARGRDAPGEVPGFDVAVDRDLEAVVLAVVVGVLVGLRGVAAAVVVQINEVLAGVELPVVVQINIGFPLVPLPVVVQIGQRLDVIPAAVVVAVGKLLAGQLQCGRTGELQVVHRGAALDADHVEELVITGPVIENNLRRTSIGAQLARTGDADEGFGARVGLDQAGRLQLAVIGERVGDSEGVPEVRNIVVKVGQRDGQLVKGVVDIVVDVKIVAALHHGIAVGAVFGAGDAESETLLELLLAQSVGERLREVNLHRVVVVDRIAVALRPRDIHALVGSACLHRAHHLGDARRIDAQIDIARRGRFVQADPDAGGAVRRNVIVAEAPFFFAGQIGRGHICRLTPRLRQSGIVLVVAVDVGVILAALADAVLVGIDERLETGTVAIENLRRRVVVAIIAIGDVEPHVLDGQVGVDNEFVARAADRVAIPGREEHRARRRQRVVVKDLRESVVERCGAERASALPIGQVSAGTDHVKSFAEPGLHGPRP